MALRRLSSTAAPLLAGSARQHGRCFAPVVRFMSAEAESSAAPSSDPPPKIQALCDELCALNVIEMNQLVTLFKVHERAELSACLQRSRRSS
jgi:hypothetical protein